MPNKARVAIKVLDVDASIAFYTRFLNFALVESQPDVGIAYIRDSDGDLLLLAPPQQTDPRSLLDEPRLVFKPGDNPDLMVARARARLAVILARADVVGKAQDKRSLSSGSVVHRICDEAQKKGIVL